MRKYVHRAGRTARAGRAGDCWTLVEEQEARHFKGMMREAGRASAEVKKVRVDVEGEEVKALEVHYEVSDCVWCDGLRDG